MAPADPDAPGPGPALVLGLTQGILPPPWFVPIEAPACGAVLDVPADRTNDGVARRFACDLPRGHMDRPDDFPAERGRHRQVTDLNEGESFTWPIGLEELPEM